MWPAAFLHILARGPHSRTVAHLTPHVILTDKNESMVTLAVGWSSQRETEGTGQLSCMFMWGGASTERTLPQCLSPQEGMLRNLQKSVEQEEQVWKAKVSSTEEELQKVQHRPSDPRQGPATRISLQEVHLPWEFKHNLLKKNSWVRIL